MKLVKFKNGKFGVRKWELWIGYQYADMKKTGQWWFQDIGMQDWAQGTEAQAREALARETDYGTPVP